MAYTYADWTTYRDGNQGLTAEGFSRLNLHILEVSQAVTAAVQSNGSSRDPAVLQMYLSELKKDLASERRTSGAAHKVHAVRFAPPSS